MTRSYEFVLTVEVDEDHVAFDDPEWVADAAWGALTNDYGLVCTFGRINLVEGLESDRAIRPHPSPSEE